MNEVRTTKPRRAPLGESHLRDHSRMWRCACFVCPVTTAPQRHFNTRVSLMALLGGALAALFLIYSCLCLYRACRFFVFVSLLNATVAQCRLAREPRTHVESGLGAVCVRAVSSRPPHAETRFCGVCNEASKSAQKIPGLRYVSRFC